MKVNSSVQIEVGLKDPLSFYLTAGFILVLVHQSNASEYSV